MSKGQEFDFDKIMEYSIFVLRTNGAHPDTPRNYRWYLQYVIMKTFYTLHLYFLIHGFLAIEDFKANIIDACGIVTLMVIHVVITFKHWVMTNYQKQFKFIIQDIKNFYVQAESLPEHEKEIIRKFTAEGRKVTKFWVVMTSLGTINFLVQPFVAMFFLFMIRGEFQYVQIVDMKYPGFLSTLEGGTLFWTVYPLWVFFLYYSVCMYLGLVPLGPMFILHACAQLELLKGRTMELFQHDGIVTPEERTKKLRAIASDLQVVYDFVDNVKIALKLLYELTLKGTSLMCPFTAYVLIEALAQGQFRSEFLTLLVGAISICSMPCYYGEKLIEQSSDLRDAVYMCGWEGSYDRKTRTTLLVIMTRLVRTVAIRSVFVTVCMQSLTEVANQAYVLFNLLHATV